MGTTHSMLTAHSVHFAYLIVSLLVIRVLGLFPVLTFLRTPFGNRISFHDAIIVPIFLMIYTYLFRDLCHTFWSVALF